MFSTDKTAYTNGFHMTFANGWTVSVQFGKGNYISDRGHHGQSVDAEIAAWDKDGAWYDFGDDGKVKGWVKADEVADFMVMIKAK
jgi:hypothetical protein